MKPTSVKLRLDARRADMIRGHWTHREDPERCTVDSSRLAEHEGRTGGVGVRPSRVVGRESEIVGDVKSTLAKAVTPWSGCVLTSDVAYGRSHSSKSEREEGKSGGDHLAGCRWSRLLKVVML